MKAVIFGLEGPQLSPAERAFFAAADPWGYILFRRNIVDAAQARALTDSLRTLSGRNDLPILIDQEGGRVQRLGPPLWPAYPPARRIGDLFDSDPEAARAASRMLAQLIAHDLHELGITVDCLPVLDVPVPGAHDIIGDRAYGLDPQRVAILGRAAAEGLMVGGVLPVIKHIPGHGRAFADSHLALPVVETALADLEAHDFAPFRALADMPMAMTAHVVYAAIDAARPATLSGEVVGRVIRGFIGFDGLLMSDDLSMQALSGNFAQRTGAAIAAGCDLVLHCNGLMDEMEPIAAHCPVLTGAAARRAAAALARLRPPEPLDRGQVAATLRGKLAAFA